MVKRRVFLKQAAVVLSGAGILPGTLLRDSHLAETPFFEESDVYVSGDGYPTYRIPSVVVTRNGTLLAFAEGRASQSDASQNDLVLRRSVDGGRSWTPIVVVAEDGANVLVNPTAVVIEDTGRVLMMYQRYPHGFHERDVEAGYAGDRICRSYVMRSDDEGVTWSEPRDITRSVKRPTGATSIASGPGVGIQLRNGPHAGRIIMPFNEGPWGAWNVYAVYSDDGGVTWQYGETAPEGPPGRPNEVQMVERADGSVLLNARSIGGAKCRKTAVSTDGGQTWTRLSDVEVLIDPECQGTIIRYGAPGNIGKDTLLFANPASAEHRVNGTVRLTYDGGETWPVARTVYPGPFAYSCLTMLPDGTIGLLYERDGYERITFARFNLAWLMAGEDAP